MDEIAAGITQSILFDEDMEIDVETRLFVFVEALRSRRARAAAFNACIAGINLLAEAFREARDFVVGALARACAREFLPSEFLS
jgi:hypothetical protein